MLVDGGRHPLRVHRPVHLRRGAARRAVVRSAGAPPPEATALVRPCQPIVEHSPACLHRTAACGRYPAPGVWSLRGRHDCRLLAVTAASGVAVLASRLGFGAWPASAQEYACVIACQSPECPLCSNCLPNQFCTTGCYYDPAYYVECYFNPSCCGCGNGCCPTPASAVTMAFKPKGSSAATSTAIATVRLFVLVARLRD